MPSADAARLSSCHRSSSWRCVLRGILYIAHRKGQDARLELGHWGRLTLCVVMNMQLLCFKTAAMSNNSLQRHNRFIPGVSEIYDSCRKLQRFLYPVKRQYYGSDLSVLIIMLCKHLITII